MATLEEAKMRGTNLAEDAVVGEPAESETLMAGSAEGQTGSKPGPDENGVRVSVGNKEGLNGDIVSGDGSVVVVTRRVVETDRISVETSFGRQSRGLFGGGEETLKGLDSVSEVEKNEGQKIGVGGDSSVFTGVGSDRKLEFCNGNGISLLLEVHGSLESVNCDSEKKCGYGDGKGLLPQNGENPGEKIGERSRKKYMKGKGGEKEEDGEVVNQDNKEEDEDNGGEGVGAQEHVYSVGDLVWGKIRSHPWWPGQIYNPFDASENANKLKQKDRLLVAYFGDSSFSWCSPSQLKPFVENFKEMSKQSNSNSFVNAVQKALEEMGRVVELGMTCSCVPDKDLIGLTRSVTVNAGIRTGVLVPQGDTGKLSSSWLEPVELIANIRYLAVAFSVTCKLELTLLKSLLSAFYRAKGVYSLPVYYEPQAIEGLDDNSGNGVLAMNEVRDPMQGPIEEDWLSSPVCRAEYHEISEDKLYRRRKQKSVAELMKEDMTTEPKDKKWSMTKDGTHPGKAMSGKKRAKMGGTDKAESHGAGGLTSSGRKRGMKMDEIYESSQGKEDKVCSVENGGWDEKEDKESLVARGRKRNGVSGVENVDRDTKEETKNISSPRERKKSKYLTSPFTSPIWRVRNSSFKRVSEIEAEGIAKIARMGERMTKAAGQLTGSPPIVKCSDEKFQKKQSKELSDGCDTSGSSCPQTTEQDQDQEQEPKKITFPIDGNASVTKMLFLVRSVAVNSLHLRDKRSLATITGFVSTFRSSVYLNGSNYKIYHKRQHGRKRKSLNSEPGPQGEDLDHTVCESPESKSLRRRNEKNEQRNLCGPKLKKAANVSGLKTNDKEADKDASPPVALMVSFPPGFSLPSKDDLIKIFSKFGSLNEKETDILYNSYCGQVVFLRTSDAEEALSLVLKNSPFGAANVNYRLQYPSAALSARKASSPLKKTPANQVSSRQSDDDGVSQVGFIRQKLQMLTSMLENYDGEISHEMKSRLEDEMKCLLEKVSTMTETTTSS
ncbi:unnamed protein product [Ilex paraguariensis]|uniref:PWWP domain-containing protein n=1 Tax=Ilex paraguariensis TaxID=185542 RepID=A0ABC8SCX2_9AQUA